MSRFHLNNPDNSYPHVADSPSIGAGSEIVNVLSMKQPFPSEIVTLTCSGTQIILHHHGITIAPVKIIRLNSSVRYFTKAEPLPSTETSDIIELTVAVNISSSEMDAEGSSKATHRISYNPQRSFPRQ